MNELPMPADRDGDSGKLDALFRAYRAACPDPEPSPNFMPALWTRVEKAKTFTFTFRRISRAFVTVAAALSILLAGMAVWPGEPQRPVYTVTYVEALAEHVDNTEFAEASAEPEPNDAELI